jgi:hypothetical protein
MVVCGSPRPPSRNFSRRGELAAERDRTVWINNTDIPSARLLDWRETEAGPVRLPRPFGQCQLVSWTLHRCNGRGHLLSAPSAPCVG